MASQAMASLSTMHERAGNGSDRGGCQRKTLGEVEALSGDELHAVGVELGQDTEAIMLDFVNPAGPCGRLIGEARQARLIAPDTALQLTRY